MHLNEENETRMMRGTKNKNRSIRFKDEEPKPGSLGRKNKITLTGDKTKDNTLKIRERA